jgi:hypothetical protein
MTRRLTTLLCHSVTLDVAPLPPRQRARPREAPGVSYRRARGDSARAAIGSALMLVALGAPSPARASSWTDVVRDAIGPVPRDESLGRAASFALRAVDRAPSRAAIDEALRHEGLADVDVVPVFVAGAPAGLDAALAQRLEPAVGDRRLTHFGVATIDRGARRAVLALLVERRVELAPLAHRVSGEVIVSGRRIRDGRLELYETLPSGEVRRRPVVDRGGVFGVPVGVGVDSGLHVVELLLHGPRGPEVAALWRFERGPVVPRAPVPAREPAAVEAAIAATRRELGRDGLRRDPRLDRAAAGHAESVCARGRALHVPTAGDTPEARARREGYEGPVAENVAIAESLEAADQLVDESPSHRANRLWTEAARLGLGLARRGAHVCWVELYGR